MKKAIFSILLAAVMLGGCAEVPADYVNLDSLPNVGQQIETDDAGDLYCFDSDTIYIMNDGEMTPFAKAADILPYMGDRRMDEPRIYFAEWYDENFYIWDRRDDGIWKYDPAAGTSERLPVEFDIVIDMEGFTGLSPSVKTLLAHNGWLYIRVGNNDLWRYNFETQETFFYSLDTGDVFTDYFYFRAVDEDAMYISQNRYCWKIDIADGERTELDVSFVRETNGVILTNLYLDGYGDVYYVTQKIATGEYQLWRGRTDNSAACERVELPSVPERILFDYNGWLYYRSADTIRRLNMKNEKTELFMTYTGVGLYLVGGKLCARTSDGGQFEYEVLADLAKMD